MQGRLFVVVALFALVTIPALCSPVPHTRDGVPRRAPNHVARLPGHLNTLRRSHRHGRGRAGHLKLPWVSRIQESEESEEEEEYEEGEEDESGEYAEDQPGEEPREDTGSQRVEGQHEGVVVHRAEPQEGDDESFQQDTGTADLDAVHEPEAEPTVKVAAPSEGSGRPSIPQQLTTMKSGGEFRGIPGGVVGGANVTHLSYMVFKLIKTLGVTSVIDMPCRHNLHWFPSLLHRLDFEIVNFKYYCVDTHEKTHADIEHLFSDAGSPEFIHIPPGGAVGLPKADMLFSWDGPQEWGVRESWAFFTGIRQVRPEYLLITNNPAASNANSNKGVLNVRKQPFHFAEAKRVISNMQIGEDAPSKQMLLYEMDGIRKGF